MKNAPNFFLRLLLLFLLTGGVATHVSALDVLFVGNGSSPTSGADGSVMAYLENRYGAANVDYLQASASSSGSENGYDVLVLSSTFSSGQARSKFHNSTVGIVNWEEAIMDEESGEFGLCTGAMVKSQSTTQLTITGSHPITEGLSGTISFNSTAETLNTPSVFAGLDTLATAANGTGTGNAALFIAEQGDTLVASSGASPAKGLRVMFPMTNSTFNSLTADGLQLFGQAVDWAGGVVQATPPSVTNSAATDLQPTSATLNGQVTDNGGENPTITIYWGDNDGGTNPGSWDDTVSLGTQSGAFNTNITSLTPSTTYFFRAFASNSGGTAWAPATTTFATTAPAVPPTVVNTPASNIAFFTADIGGQVTATGGETPTATLYWGDNDGGTTPGSWDTTVNLGLQSGSFSNQLPGLTHNTSYFFRASATNSGGAAWASSTASFTTQQVLAPGVTNTAATDISGASAKLGGTITSTGGESPNVTLYYGDNDGGTNPASWDNELPLGVQTADFESSIGNLDPLTTYFFSAGAVNTGGTTWGSPSQSFTTTQVSTVRLNEFMASNNSIAVPNAVAGTFDDWIEIHNSGASPTDVGGWHLTDTAGTLDKWTFPTPTIIPGNGFLVVFATGDNAPDGNGNLHTNFGLSAGGEYLALVRPDLSIAGEFGSGGTDYPAQNTDISYGLDITDLSSVFFAVPTPGAPNSSQQQVADTKFSHDRGFYTSAFNVTITTATPGATIRFTLNGSVPEASGNGTSYSAPIPITTTTILRARAFKSGFASTDTDTQSYIFPNDVVTQTRPSGYPTSWGGEPSADYDVDTQISQSGQYAARFLQGLRSIPTVSVSSHQDAFFRNSSPQGIYVDTQNRNLEAPVSAEYFHPDAAQDGVNIENGFQLNCGFKLQGGASRTPSSSIKHSFSLRFKTQYGPGKLRYPLFKDSPVESFDSIHLRAMYNNSWIHRSSDQPRRATMIRDQWARDCMIDMGSPDGGQGHFAHLFINGIYWGVFNLHERLENDHYAAYHGYDDETVLGRNPGQATSEENASFKLMTDVVTNAGSTWAQIQAVLDIDNYIDYVIVEDFGRNADLKSGDNWRAAGGGSANAPWRFYCWDTERILESQTNTSSPSNSGQSDGALIFDDLSEHREFRVRFQDRAYMHLHNGGALTNLENRARFQKYVDEIDTAIVCESARWGDDRSGGGFLGNFSRDENWTKAVYGTPSGPGTSPTNGVLGSWFPGTGANRTSIIINAWRTKQFPGSTDTFLGSITAPVFTVNGSAQHGGEVPSGGTLSATTATGSVYYTTDGTDPRAEGGGLAPGAILLSGNMTLPASGGVRMRTRVGGGDSWSPLSEATFYLEPRAGANDLRISEIHYNAPPPTAVEAAEAGAGAALKGGDFEFLEIVNTGATTINLDGVNFSTGLDFTFTLMTLAPGARAVVVADTAAFEIRHGSGLPVAGQFTGALDNAGEQLAYHTWSGNLVQDFTYEDSGAWPGRPDGDGSSLEVVDTSSDYDDPANWRPSCEYNGSPGMAGAGTDGRIVVNEVLTHSDLPQVDAIELLNTTGSAIPLANWYLSDSKTNYRKFRIPSGSIAANGYLTFDESDFNADDATPILGYAGTIATAPTTVMTNAHGLATGDVITISGYGGISAYNGTFEVTVVNATTFTINVPFLDDHASMGTYTSGQPFLLSSLGEDVWLLEGDASGRLLKFVDHVDFAAARNGETLGRWPNGAGTGTLVSMTANTPTAPNSGPQVGPVIISEVMYHPDSPTEENLEFVEICNSGGAIENLANWRMRGRADFDFSGAQTLAPGASLVVVAFNPQANIAAANAFRIFHSIDSTITLVGPFSDGPLGNDTGTVRIQRPDTLSDGVYPQVTEDEVIYESSAPWPSAPNGTGPSLQRSDIRGFGNFASNWTSAVANPGGKVLDYDEWRTGFFGPGSPAGSEPLDDFDFDSVLNLVEFALGLNPTISDVELLPQLVPEGANVTISYEKDLLKQGIVYQVQSSPDLFTWTNVPDVLVSTSGYTETRKASVSSTGVERRFLRIRITSL